MAFGLSAYLMWGVLPVYFKLLSTVPAFEFVAHRIVWSLVLLILILAMLGRIGGLVAVLSNARTMRALLASAALIGANWTIYVWAVLNHHIVAASLGYFLNPLLNVLLGVLVLGERLSRGQRIAIAFAAAGVAIAAVGALSQLWISVALASTFALYGLVRKMTPVGAIEGLAVETALLVPLCIGGLVWLGSVGTLAFGQDRTTDALLIGSAVVTSVPMMLFAAAAKRLPYSTLGVIQYVSPSTVFVLGVLVYGEALVPAMIGAFLLIWIGLAVFTLDMLRRPRQAPMPIPTE